MNYQTQNSLPHSVVNALHDPSKLNVHDFIRQFKPTIFHLLQSGLAQQLIHLISLNIHTFLKSPSVISYMYLLDQLASLGLTYCIEPIIVQLYVTVFVGMVSNQKIVMELKVLRKLWLGRINFALLEAMRSEVYYQVGLDLQIGFNQKDVQLVADHYRRMNINKEVIVKHLECMMQTQGKIQAYSQKDKGFKRSRDYSIDQNNERFRKVRVDNNRQTKRVQTEKKDKHDNTLSSYVSNVKEVDSVKKQSLQMLNSLRSMGKIQCKQCGMRFSLPRYYAKHIEEHLKANKQQYKRKFNHVNPLERYQELQEKTDFLSLAAKKKEQRGCLSPKQWAEEKDIEYVCSVKAFKANYGQDKQAICSVCDKTLEIFFYKPSEKWAYKDFVQASEEGSNEVKVYHRNCFVLVSAEDISQ